MLFVDMPDIAGFQPAIVGKGIRAVAGVVGARHPGPAELQFADILAVMGEYLTRVVDHANLNARHGPATFYPPGCFTPLPGIARRV